MGAWRTSLAWPVFEVLHYLCLILRFKETLTSKSAMYCLEINQGNIIITAPPPPFPGENWWAWQFLGRCPMDLRMISEWWMYDPGDPLNFCSCSHKRGEWPRNISRCWWTTVVEDATGILITQPVENSVVHTNFLAFGCEADKLWINVSTTHESCYISFLHQVDSVQHQRLTTHSYVVEH